MLMETFSSCLNGLFHKRLLELEKILQYSKFQTETFCQLFFFQLATGSYLWKTLCFHWWCPSAHHFLAYLLAASLHSSMHFISVRSRIEGPTGTGSTLHYLEHLWQSTWFLFLEAKHKDFLICVWKLVLGKKKKRNKQPKKKPATDFWIWEVSCHAWRWISSCRQLDWKYIVLYCEETTFFQV